MQAVQCVLIANKLSAHQALVVLKFAFGSLARTDCRRGLLLLIARKELIGYA